MQDFAPALRTLRDKLERRCFTFRLCELARQLCESIPSDIGPVCGQTLSRLANPEYVFSAAVSEKVLKGTPRIQAVGEVANEDRLLHQAYLLATNPSPKAKRLIREKYALFNKLPHRTGFSEASLQECLADLNEILGRTQAATPKQGEGNGGKDTAPQTTRWERLKKRAWNNRGVVVFLTLSAIVVGLAALVTGLETVINYMRRFIVWLWP